MVRLLTVMLIVVMVIIGVLPVSAGSSGAAFTLDCTGFAGTGGSIRLDRDNTGTGREAFIVSATDGAGNIIYEPKIDTFFVGGTVSFDSTDVIAWTSTPQYNPLTLRVVSQEGNGFSEQLVALSTGACEGLPGLAALPEGVFIVDGDTLTLDTGVEVPLGATSPSLPLNTVPPRPENPEEVAELLAGYLLVDIDNLTLRTGDGPEYTRVGIVDGGTVLIPLGRNLDFTWWYVQAGDIVGWAKAEFLIARGDLTGVTVVPSNGVVSPPTFFVYSDQFILASPSARALPLCKIVGNLEYLVVGRDRPIEWYEVQATCDNAVVRGWLRADLGAIRNPAEVFIPVTTD